MRNTELTSAALPLKKFRELNQASPGCIGSKAGGVVSWLDFWDSHGAKPAQLNLFRSSQLEPVTLGFKVPSSQNLYFCSPHAHSCSCLRGLARVFSACSVAWRVESHQGLTAKHSTGWHGKQTYSTSSVLGGRGADFIFTRNMITISFEWHRYDTDADADADADNYILYCQAMRGPSLMFTLSSVLNATTEHYHLDHLDHLD